MKGKEEVLELLQMIQDCFGDARPLPSICLEVLTHYESMPTPHNGSEAEIAAGIHCEFAGAAIGATILYHINSHYHDSDNGKACAEAVLNTCLGRVRTSAMECVEEGCKEVGLKNPFEASNHNKSVADDILAELANERRSSHDD